jgi:hypothetical protein
MLIVAISLCLPETKPPAPMLLGRLLRP